MEGLVHEVEGDGKKELEWTKLKHVPSDKVVAKFEGSWRGDIKLSQLRGDKVRSPRAFLEAVGLNTDWSQSVSSSLVAPGSLPPLPKRVRDIDRQAPEESRRFWDDVTRAIVEKRYSEATKVKQVIEQRQRDIAAERQRKGQEFEPAWFQDGWQEEGKAKLTEEGWRMLRKELEAEGY